MIDKTISHYKIIEKLGSGGMGIVYKARDQKLDRFVALKFLPAHLTNNEEAKQRFIYEAKAASALQHNNICTIHEIDETEDNQVFICMDYYEGETLDKKIKEKPLHIFEAINIVNQIAQGLANAHEKGIVHRDIKPANIMLTEEGVVKVLDFGLAKLSTQTKLTKDGSTLGTIAYMSPEQARGEQVDNRTDIWSLGVLLYEMLSGQLPFKGDYDQAVVYSIINDEFEPITGLSREIPSKWEQIITKCLRKNPDDRYHHMFDLIDDLQSLNVESEPAPVSREKDPKQKRLIIRTVSLVSVFIIILFITGYFFVYLPEANKPSDPAVPKWENSIAVLPFTDLSPDRDQEYFCDGMTEQIITNLSKIKRLKVIARTSVMSYKDTQKKIPQIGKELNVSHILEGSIRKFRDQIRVTAQLINTMDGSYLWADDFDRRFDHVFEIQDDISQAIASNLLSTLSIQDNNVIRSAKSSKAEAYDLFLKGKYYLRKFERYREISDINKSEQMFKKTIEADPNYAPAYAYLSDVYGTKIDYQVDKKEKYLPLQEKYIQIAYELDSLSADVLGILSFLYLSQGKPDKRYTYLRKSLVLDPNNYSSNLQMGIFLRNYGLPNHALEFFNKAAELNPGDTWVFVARGWAYTYAGEFDKAEYDYLRALEISSNDYWALYVYTEFLIMMNRLEEARTFLLKFETSYPREKSVKYCKSLLLAAQRDSLNAIKEFEQIRMGLLGKINFYSVLDDRDRAISLLNKTHPEQKSDSFPARTMYLQLKHLPWYANLRSYSRFQEILANHKKLYEENLAKYGDIDI